MPEPSSSPHRWNQIKRLTLHPQVQSLADYEEAVIKGVGDAVAYLSMVDLFERLTVADLQAVHFHLFKGVHPWAGAFRNPGQMAVVAGFPAADPARIRRELELALYQTRHLLADAFGDEFKLLAAMSFLHVRFERIHPFQDATAVPVEPCWRCSLKRSLAICRISRTNAATARRFAPQRRGTSVRSCTSLAGVLG